MDSISVLVGNLADELYQAGKVTNKFENEGFYTRLSKLEEQFPGAAVLLHKKGVLPKQFADLWTNPSLLDIVEQIIGPEIVGHPVWNLRTKTPMNPFTTVPWHQDAAYLNEGSEKTLQPTAWIPLLDANLENGCMEVYKYGHLAQKVCTHECCAGPSWYVMIPEEKIKETLGENVEKVLCEVPLGGFLLINQLIPHRSLENKSKNIRWSIDLRWQRPNEPHGFFGLKEPILMRTASNPSHKPDWSQWASEDRAVLWEETGNVKKEEDPFNTVITGPWMKRWKITHHNNNTKHFDPSADWTGWHKS